MIEMSKKLNKSKIKNKDKEQSLWLLKQFLMI
jgi:hypothetical protein